MHHNLCQHGLPHSIAQQLHVRLRVHRRWWKISACASQMVEDKCVHCLDQMMRPQKHINKVSNHSTCSMCFRCSPPKIVTMANGGRASRQSFCTHMVFNNNNGRAASSQQRAVIASHLVCRLSDANTTTAIRVRVRSSSRWGSHELLPTRPQQALDLFDRCRAEHLSA